MLSERPKVLVINCHGSYDYNKEGTTFWFENVDMPSIVDVFNEERLSGLFQSSLAENPFTSVKLIIISACHSSRLAKIFHDAKIPSVVSINSTT